ncbi:MAG: type 1 glutamine amidotransferase [Ilumatobacteraceae bacterium]
MSAPLRLGVLCMDDLPRRAQPVLGDYPALYAHLLRDQPVETVDFAAHRGDLPASVDDCDGWVLGGGRPSVYDELDWICDAEAFVRAAVAAERPVVGICFGHQLVASALGGTVERADVGWGLGALEYNVTRPVPWFGGRRMTLIASHRDQVTELPDGAEVWASAEYCPAAGMTIGERTWTLQGHPEFTAEIALELYTAREGLLGQATVDDAMATLGRPLSNDAVAAAIRAFVAGDA